MASLSRPTPGHTHSLLPLFLPPPHFSFPALLSPPYLPSPPNSTLPHPSLLPPLPYVLSCVEISSVCLGSLHTLTTLFMVWW